MKNIPVLLVLTTHSVIGHAQVGIRNVSPNLTMYIWGAISTSYRNFAGASTAVIADSILSFARTRCWLNKQFF